MDSGSTWKKVYMVTTRAGHSVVGYKDGFFAFGGWVGSAAHNLSEWANLGGSFSTVNIAYGGYGYTEACCVADEESGFIYHIGGYTPQ